MSEFKYVPVEPTDEMLKAAMDASTLHYGACISKEEYSGCYKSMIAAAPEQPAPAEPLDREAIRNAALEEAAKLCEKAVAPRDMVRAIGSSAHYAHCANEIRALKSTSDTEK